MNETFEKFPQEAAASLLCCEIVSIFGTHQMVLSSGIIIPSSLALGFAISRPFRRIRFPIELLFAAGLRKAVPELAEVKMSVLIGGQVPSAVQSSRFMTRMKSWKTITAVTDMVDKYGACYFIGARWTGVLSVLGFTTLINYGVDVEPYLQHYLGMSPSLNAALGSWAAAVTLSSFLYPVTVGIGGAVLAPAVGKARLRYTSNIRRK
jgi:hypothetical protein